MAPCVKAIRMYLLAFIGFGALLRGCATKNDTVGGIGVFVHGF